MATAGTLAQIIVGLIIALLLEGRWVAERLLSLKQVSLNKGEDNDVSTLDHNWPFSVLALYTSVVFIWAMAMLLAAMAFCSISLITDRTVSELGSGVVLVAIALSAFAMAVMPYVQAAYSIIMKAPGEIYSGRTMRYVFILLISGPWIVVIIVIVTLMIFAFPRIVPLL